MFSILFLGSYSVFVAFQVSGPAQRRTWASIEDQLFLEKTTFYLYEVKVESRFSRKLDPASGEPTGPWGILPDPRGSSLGSLSLPRQASENLEEVPRIWEGEGYRRSEMMDASDDDHWVSGDNCSGNPVPVLPFCVCASGIGPP